MRGIDAEVSFANCWTSAWTSTNNLIIGGSFVSKYQEDRDPLLVAAGERWSMGGAGQLHHAEVEYLHRVCVQDQRPQLHATTSSTRPGQALHGECDLLREGASERRVGAHSFDNMFYQSDRSSPTPFDLNINFLPPLTKQHTYNLPATLYPYATQPNGEVSAQGEVFYKWKKGSKLGGKYGTKLAVNYSVAYALDTVHLGARG